MKNRLNDLTNPRLYAKFLKRNAYDAEVTQLDNRTCDVIFVDKNGDYVGGYIVPRDRVREVVQGILGVDYYEKQTKRFN